MVLSSLLIVLLWELTSGRCGLCAPFLPLSNEQLNSLKQNSQKVWKIHTLGNQFLKSIRLIGLISAVSQNFSEYLSQNGSNKCISNGSVVLRNTIAHQRRIYNIFPTTVSNECIKKLFMKLEKWLSSKENVFLGTWLQTPALTHQLTNITLGLGDLVPFSSFQGYKNIYGTHTMQVKYPYKWNEIKSFRNGSHIVSCAILFKRIWYNLGI